MRTPRRTPTAAPGAALPVRGRRAHAGPPADEVSEEPLGALPDEIPTRAGRWRMRPGTVRAKIVCLLMVPVVSLLALWAYATVTTAQDVARLRQLQRVDTQVRAPVAAAVAALQAEREAAVRHATDPAAVPGVDLTTLGERTDGTVAKLRLGDRNTVADGEELPAGVADRLETFVADVEQLRTLRTSVLDRRTGWSEAYAQYTRTISAAFAVGGALTGIQDAELGSDARVLLEFSRAGEALAQEDAVLAGARLAGRLDGQRLRLFTGAVNTRLTLLEATVSDLRGPERATWQNLAAGSAYATLAAVENKVLGTRPGVRAIAAAPEATWTRTHARVQGGMRAIEADAGHDVADRADPFTRGLLTPAGAAVLLGLAAVAASLVISVRIGRGLVVELVSLRNSALEIARHKLPQAMLKLRAGEEIDIRAEAPRTARRGRDRTGRGGPRHRPPRRPARRRGTRGTGQRHLRGLRQSRAPQPGPRAPPTEPPRQHGAQIRRSERTQRPVPARPPHHPYAAPCGEPDHPLRSGTRPGLAPAGLPDERGPRRRLRGRGLRARGGTTVPRGVGRGHRRRRPHASPGGDRRERRPVLTSAHQGAHHRRTGRQRLRRGGRGPGTRDGQGDPRRGQPPHRTVRGARPVRQRPARPLRGQQARCPARHQGASADLALRRHHRGRPAALALLHGGAADRSPRAAVDRERAVEREYARVPAAADPPQEPVQASADRPALVAPAQASAETAPESPPPRVTALRLHRPPEGPVEEEESDDLPRRVRQAHLAPNCANSAPKSRPDAGLPKRGQAHPRGRTGPHGGLPRRLGARRRQLTRPRSRPGPETGRDSSEGDRA